MSDTEKGAGDAKGGRRMTATDELRSMLYERGVEYRFNENTKVFEWHFEGTDGEGHAHATEVGGGINIIACSLTPEQAIAATLGPKITEDTSDGWHTFKELYHHRALLFSVIVSNYRDLCWKSKRHHDGKLLDWNFIVGIDTPWGQASYHYGMDYWDLFDCKVLERAPYYDGYSANESVARIARLSELEPSTPGRGKCKAWLYKPEYGSSDCTICECGEINDISANYCNRCGRQIKVVWE